MARLSDVIKSGPIETKFNGLYILNLPMKEMENRFGDFEKKLQDEPEETIVNMFQNLICDENGEMFDDVESWDQITGIFSQLQIQEIMIAVGEALSPQAQDEKKN
jgi:hypothetical protein